MEWIVVVALGCGVIALIRQLSTFMVAVLVTLIAAYYYWRRARLDAAIGRLDAAARRRSLATQLRLSVDMTAHFSLFPTAALRGYILARGLARSG